MAEPTKKAATINDFLSKLAGRPREATIENDVCMTCGNAAVDFRDELSQKEYTISGMCQTCQDSVFSSDPLESDYDDEPEYDGQPDEYTEWQDFMGGDDWDHGQYDDPH